MAIANTFSLLADIGGTNTRVALSQGGVIERSTIERYPNADFTSLAHVLDTFLTAVGAPDCAGACVAVAGPVRGGRAKMTNLDWVIDEETLAAATKAETVAILNDLPAQGYALGAIAPDTILPLLGTPPAPPRRGNATQLVIGAGTGFNAAPVYDIEGMGRYVAPAESGHVTLPLRGAQADHLDAFLSYEHGFSAVEDALAGRGLPALYAFVSGAKPSDARRSGAQVLDAYEAGDPHAKEAVALYTKLFGAAVGDLALAHLPFEGIYLVGGMARAMAPHFAENGFADAIADKGRFADLARSFSISVIADDFAALTGCAAFLAQKQNLKKSGTA